MFVPLQFDPPLFPPKHPGVAADLHQHSPTLTTREQHTEHTENQLKGNEEEQRAEINTQKQSFLRVYCGYLCLSCCV